MARDHDYPHTIVPGANLTDSSPRFILYADLNRVRIVIPENTSEFNAGPERSTVVDLHELCKALRALEEAHRE